MTIWENQPFITYKFWIDFWNLCYNNPGLYMFCSLLLTRAQLGMAHACLPVNKSIIKGTVWNRLYLGQTKKITKLLILLLFSKLSVGFWDLREHNFSISMQRDQGLLSGLKFIKTSEFRRGAQKEKRVWAGKKSRGFYFAKQTSSLVLGSDNTEKLYVTVHWERTVCLSSLYEALRLLFNYPNTSLNADKKNQWQIQSPWNAF